MASEPLQLDLSLEAVDGTMTLVRAVETLSGRNSPFASNDAAVARDVAEYCERYAIRSYLDTAIRLANKHFHPVDAMSIYLSNDPEWGDDWLVVSVVSKLGLSQATDAYDRYLREWITVCDREKRKKIRFSYNIV